MRATINYTEYRKGRKSMHGLPIEVCPKCGKRGEHTFVTNPKTGRISHYYNHVMEIKKLGDFAFLETREICFYIEGV
jgi:hypothetical protein